VILLGLARRSRGTFGHKEAQIENLQRALFYGKKAVRELDATRERLAGIERVCQQLREENRRLEKAGGL
jgi:hypothetical protein